MDVNPIDLQKHLKGISYPATKADLLRTAEANGASDDIKNALRSVEGDHFAGPDEVQAALA